jgi:hypothetical protein
MNSLHPYENLIDTLLGAPRSKGCKDEISRKIEHHLNGGANEFIQHSLNKDFIKDSGIFFSDKKRAAYLAKKLLGSEKTFTKPILDPTCGGGDLLISCARFFPLANNLHETLLHWSTLVYGYDIHEGLVSIAKKRLILLAAQRMNEVYEPSNYNQYFKNLRTRDFISSSIILPKGFYIISNPPFHPQDAPLEYPFSTGKTNSAAIILYKCLQILPINGRIAAILPDVIRSGSRYKKLMDYIQSKLKYTKINLEGRFSKDADIDIITLSGTLRSKQKELLQETVPDLLTIKDFFKVSVGPIVPHRHTNEGEIYSYITARDIKTNSSVCTTPNKIAFNSTVYKAPFIVLKRTSSPKDKNRMCAAIVKGKVLYAAENHVLIIQPNDNSLKSCSNLLSFLKSNQCRKWINERIRCRHFTVSAIREIPYKIT